MCAHVGGSAMLPLTAVSPPNLVFASAGARQGDTDVSFKLWARPDCAGTEFETTYRTWFHFGVRGGRKGEMIHLTMCNLNKQNNLYAHDMRPVTKAMPSKPKWDRIKFSASYSVSDGEFILRFKHRFETDGEETFFAFCYPQVRRTPRSLLCTPCRPSSVAVSPPRFNLPPTTLRSQSYEECQQRLQRFDSLYHWRPGMSGEAKLAQALASRGVGDGVAHTHHAGAADETGTGAGVGAGAGASGRGSALRRESEARLAAALAASGQPPEFGQSPDVFTGIYWFRELLTRSKEGRRMDLITVR